MAFTRITHNTARDGNTYRVTAESTHCTVDGQLTPLAEAVAVTRDGKTGQYRVSCGKEWITLTPEVRKVDSLVKAVVEAGRFGDVIREYDDDVRYLVAHSSGVTKGQNGWKFDGVADANVGMFFGDWEAKWPGKTTIADGMVSLDTRGLTGELNLDPDTYLLSNAQRMEGLDYVEGWDNAAGDSAAAGGTYRGGDAPWVGINRQTGPPIKYTCTRGIIRFDLSAVSGTIAAAQLRLTAEVATHITDRTLHVFRIDDYTSLTAAQTWDLYDAPATVQLGTKALTGVSGGSPGTEFVTDLTPGDIDITATSSMMLRHDIDVNAGPGDTPTSITLRPYGYNDADALKPALLLTMVSGGRMLRGIGG